MHQRRLDGNGDRAIARLVVSTRPGLSEPMEDEGDILDDYCEWCPYSLHSDGLLHARECLKDTGTTLRLDIDQV